MQSLDPTGSSQQTFEIPGPQDSKQTQQIYKTMQNIIGNKGELSIEKTDGPTVINVTWKGTPPTPDQTDTTKNIQKVISAYTDISAYPVDPEVIDEPVLDLKISGETLPVVVMAKRGNVHTVTPNLKVVIQGDKVTYFKVKKGFLKKQYFKAITPEEFRNEYGQALKETKFERQLFRHATKNNLIEDSNKIDVTKVQKKYKKYRAPNQRIKKFAKFAAALGVIGLGVAISISTFGAAPLLAATLTLLAGTLGKAYVVFGVLSIAAYNFKSTGKKNRMLNEYRAASHLEPNVST